MRIGIVGLGFMGMVHYRTYEKLPGVEVVALADSHPERLAGDWTGIKGNFGPPGEQMDLSGVATFATADELLASAEVDMVDITLPPALHAEVAVAALEAGRHVFTEKPMAMATADCDRMIAAASAADRQLLVGHVLPFFPEYAWALSEIRSGEHGRLLGGSFKRIISDPAWLAHYWSAEKIGGPMLDLHVHDAHFIRLAFGDPTQVTTAGSTREGLPEHWHSLLAFEGGASVHAVSGVINQPSRPFQHGFEIRLERATLAFEFAVETVDGTDQAGYHCQPTIYSEAGARRVDLGDGDPMNAFEAELAHAVAVVREGADADALSAELARDAIRLCLEQQKQLFSS